MKTRLPRHQSPWPLIILTSAFTFVVVYSFGGGPTKSLENHYHSSPQKHDTSSTAPSLLPILTHRKTEVREEDDPHKLTSISTSTTKPLTLQRTYVCNMGKADKTNGGEDAWFVTSRGNAVGVCDGVGGWSAEGIDAGLYSKHLAKELKLIYEDHNSMRWNSSSPAEVLMEAAKKTFEKGSSTVSVASLSPEGILTLYSLGDSNVIWVRNNAILYESPEQWYNFNTPFQIGTMEKPSIAKKGSVKKGPARVGDIIVVASDGLWDNISPKHVLSLLEAHKDDLKGAACGILEKALYVARND
eukprot:PhF_6_TR890/c0_g1_i2/m.1394/K17508/PTC7, PPTC7; protein phosphatase PTC7